MRQLKFRAWLKEKQLMIDVCEMTFLYDEVHTVSDEHYNFYASDEIKLMQFTGLKDKHGEEIFEGDIVEFHDKDQSYQGIVTYDKEFGEFTLVERDGFDYSFEYLSVWYCDLSSLEVIGNKYEDPELLKGK